MKNWIALIGLLILSLLGNRAGHAVPVSLPTVQPITVQAHAAAHLLTYDNGNETSFRPVARHRQTGDMEFGNAHNLAQQLTGTSQRLHRQTTVETSQFIKKQLQRMAQRTTVLTHCNLLFHDTSRTLACDDACEHYIFAMRRILI